MIARNAGVGLGLRASGLVGVAALAWGLVWGVPASAFTLLGPKPATIKAERDLCRAPVEGGSFKRMMFCVSTAYYRVDPVNADDANLKLAFDAWNSDQPDGAKWTLETKPALDWTLKIDTFSALALSNLGGVTFQIKIDTKDDKLPYFWSQGLFVNFKPGPIKPTVPAFRTMDTATSCGRAMVILCPPLYPHPYGDRRFFDEPKGPWPDAKFDAWAMLSQVDYAARKLTVFGGVGWGFELSAVRAQPIPEPGVWAMLIAGFGLVGGATRVRRSGLITTR